MTPPSVSKPNPAAKDPKPNDTLTDTPVKIAFDAYTKTKEYQNLISPRVGQSISTDSINATNFAIFVAGWQARPLVAPVMQPHAKP